jgi:hypothetical protein
MSTGKWDRKLCCIHVLVCSLSADLAVMKKRHKEKTDPDGTGWISFGSRLDRYIYIA